MDNGHIVEQDDSAMDLGGQGATWCGRCGAVYGTPGWAAECQRGRKALKRMARVVRMWKRVAKAVGLTISAQRAEDQETGERFHGFECNGLGIELISGQWWSTECRQSGGSFFEPPSVDWETSGSPHATWQDALEWLVREAHTRSLSYALEVEGEYCDWAMAQDDPYPSAS